MAEQEQNRSEPATAFKLAEARKQGQVAKSAELTAFIAVSALAMVLAVKGESAALELADVWTGLFSMAGSVRLENPQDSAWLGQVVATVLRLTAPFALLAIVFTVVANLVQTGPIFTLVPLRPKFDRVNPVEGFKRVFSKRILFELVKTLLKIALFGAVLSGFALALYPSLPALMLSDPGSQVGWLGSRGQGLFTRLLLVMLAVGVLDVVYVRWQFNRQMMMSRRELKDEIKRREGDPAIRAKLRELQRENLKQARSLSRVPEADVLITNPEHLAIALKYTRGEMTAPHVIAKGSEAWAADMKAIARKHGIPQYERRPLARFLFRRSQLDRPIPSDTFVEVARIYADVEAQRRRAARYEVRQ